MFGIPPSFRSKYSENSVVHWLLIINITCFVLQNILVQIIKYPNALSWLTLSGFSLKAGAPWSLLTYSFFHGSILHLLVNMLGLYFLGKPLEMLLGNKRFLAIYMLSTCIGGVCWLCLHFGSTHYLMGASSAILGLLVYFCCLNPNQPITLLLFFILPITIKPKWLGLSILGLELFGFVFDEFGGKSMAANSAHLGGMLAGLLCFLQIQKEEKGNFSYTSSLQKPIWAKIKKRLAPTSFKVNIHQKEAFKIEIDRILDKINIEGFGSLTTEEKSILDKAKDLLKH